MAFAVRVLVVALAVLSAARGGAADWRIVADRSTLGFQASVEQPNADSKTVLRARLPAFRGSVRFDPAEPESARIVLWIDMTQIDVTPPGIRPTMTGPDWLATRAHIEARFAADGLIPLGDNRFRSEGVLTLRGTRAPVALVSEITIDAAEARATGTADVRRALFGVGAGAGPGLASAVVTVTFDLLATRSE